MKKVVDNHETVTSYEAATEIGIVAYKQPGSLYIMMKVDDEWAFVNPFNNSLRHVDNDPERCVKLAMKVADVYQFKGVKEFGKWASEE